MAETDFLLTAGVSPDIESAKKAGAALRAEIEKAMSFLPGAVRDAVLPYTSKLGTARSGQAIYTTVSNLRSGIKRGVAAHMALDDFTEEQQDVVREFDEFIRRRQNILRRAYLNDPTNKVLAARRKALNRPYTTTSQPDKDPLTGIFWGESDATSQAIYRNVYGKSFTEAERAQARAGAIAAFSNSSANPHTISAAIYRNIYGKEMTPDERARAREDAQAVWAVKDNTKAIKNLTKVASIVGTEVVRTAAAVIPTYWQEHVDRSFWGSEQAHVARVGAIAKGAGGVAGSLIGAAIGGALTGGLGGQFVGAGIGGSIGETAGGLYGNYREKQLEAVKKSISQVNTRYRSFGIYGGQASVGYASSVEDTGMATAGDVGKMVHNSATLGARMMFGQVGESEMLMYSLMPGYFAAAMSGASSEKLAEAFAADLDKLPPQLRVWAAESVGGGSLGMMAFANSPTFDYVQRNAGRLRGIDAGIMQAGAGFHIQSGVRGVLDRELEEGAVYGDVADLMRKQRAGVYMATGSSAELAIGGYAPEDDASLSMFGLPTKMRTLRKLFVNDQFATPSYYRTAARMASSENTDDFVEGRTTIARTRERVLQTINVNIDGETIKTQENTITEDELNGGYSLSYTLGM